MHTRTRASLNAKPSVCSHGDFATNLTHRVRESIRSSVRSLRSFVRCASLPVYARSSKRVQTSGGCSLGCDIGRTAPRDGYFAGEIKFVNTRSRIDPVTGIFVKLSRLETAVFLKLEYILSRVPPINFLQFIDDFLIGKILVDLA